MRIDSMVDGCVAIVQYSELEKLPPVMTLLSVLKNLGVVTHYIGIESDPGKKFLETLGVNYDFIPYPLRRDRFSRAVGFFCRRRLVLSILEELKRKYGRVIPWFQECHSAALVGDDVYNLGQCITTFFEFECNYGRRWIGFHLERMLRENVIVECEINRAYMTQAIHGLQETPLVIANKAEINLSTIPPISNDAEKVFEQIGGRPVFVYQGCMVEDRKDVPFLLETIARNRPAYCVLSLPGSIALKAKLAPYSNAFTLERIPAPGHLSITKRATVGIAVYSGVGHSSMRLNALYCAPNKIYEYAAFGVPTLGNKIPGLEYSVGAAGAGELCQMNEESILNAADKLVCNIEKYRDRALKFYKNTDVVSQIQAVLRKATKS